MTTAPTTDLASWLLARLAEDEQAARAADVSPNGVGDFRSHCYENLGGWPNSMADHVERHDPARVLAQVEALRAAVERGGSECGSRHSDGWADEFERDFGYRPTEHYPDDYAEGCDGCAAAESANKDREWVLRALASIWRGAEGWREEWA